MKTLATETEIINTLVSRIKENVKKKNSAGHRTELIHAGALQELHRIADLILSTEGSSEFLRLLSED